VTEIADSAFARSSVTSVTGGDYRMCDSLLFHGKTILHCFGSPSKITIPSTVREIGDAAFSYLHSVVDLSFEEGVVRIGARAFQSCTQLQTLTFPASLEVIEKSAFFSCLHLRHFTFAPESRLQCIRETAFASCRLETVILPATVKEIDPYAFDARVWPLVQFDGPSNLSIIGEFLCSADSCILLRSLAPRAFISRNCPEPPPIVIPAVIEVIGPRPFKTVSSITGVCFETGTRLKEIGESAFARYHRLTEFIVPSSVEMIGDRCFEDCSNLTTIVFEDSSNLKRIGERAFAKSRLTSITIPASTEKTDGSAFVGCPGDLIEVAPASQNFMTQSNLLMTSNGTEIVRYFGREFEITIPAKVEILRKSCFQVCTLINKILFENDSRLQTIARYGLSDCESLNSISIPASVKVIEEGAFKDCTELESCIIAENANLLRIEKEAFSGCPSLKSFQIPRSAEIIGENCFNWCEALESCLIAENANLVRIETESFSECHSLMSFDVPKSVEVIGEDCFKRCLSLDRLKFGSGESLKRLVGDSALDEALENFGFDELSNLFTIEIEDAGLHFEFPGWLSVAGESSGLTLIQDIR
jgi:hypothetical protein